MKLKLQILALVSLSFLVANKCDDEDDDKPRDHPGCPGESKRNAEDANTCVCGKGEALWAGSLKCKDCDPTTAQGAYCDCGKNSVFSFNGRLESDLGLQSPQVACAEAEHDCLPGTYPIGNGECQTCADWQCGECGQCGVGQTCVSGECVAAVACRVTDRDPNYYIVQDTSGAWYDPESGQQVEPREESVCEYRKKEQAGFTTADQFPIGTLCEVDDTKFCHYFGVIEALSQ